MICVVADPEDLKGIAFNCGNEYIDQYYRDNKIFLDDDAVTYCFWADEQKSELVGIASLSCSGIIIKSHEQFNITPAIEIKIFAVDERYQHVKFPDDDTTEKWSAYCLFYLLSEIDDIRSRCGASHVVLYSVESAVNFYSRHGFQPFKQLMAQPSNYEIADCTPMFLNI